METQPQSLPPDAAVMQILFSRMVFHSFSAVARLGVADHMSEVPRNVDDIASATSTHAPSLYRVLRLLTSVGVFTEGPDRHFALTPVGAMLQSSHPRSLRDMAIMFTDPWQITSWSRLPDSLRTGTDGTTLAFGKHAFELFPDIPDQAANFHRAMTSFSAAAAEAVLEVADFTRFRRMADCGGGHGILISRILQKTPGLQGVLFDLPEVASGAHQAGYVTPVLDSLTIEYGSFFERVPEGCDAYIMKHIVHDWSDDSCRTILSLMREQLVKSAPETGRVFLCEMVVPDDASLSPAKMLDIEMLVVTPGGRERTQPEFAALLASAGLRLVSVTPTHSPMCLIEAALAW